MTPPDNRFTVTYDIIADDLAAARGRAEAIALEQTVEIPAKLVPLGEIADEIVGRIDALDPVGPQRFRAVISYRNDTAGPDFPQFLNVVFGNSSIKAGLRVVHLDLGPGLLAGYRGPRYGVAGLRDRHGGGDGPLLCTALKPMGLSNRDLADQAHAFALGGMHLIKDDHGLMNQGFTPFRERVEMCVEAVDRANRETGLNCAYVANISGSFDKVVDYARFAKSAGAGGLLVGPGLVGFDCMRWLADQDDIALPILSHPTFLGANVVSPDSGFAHGVHYGTLQRMAGADAVIYPNFGGRFGFTKAECQDIIAGCLSPLGHLKPVFPSPGGGMTFENLAAMQDVYGDDVIFLMGGGLYERSGTLTDAVRDMRRALGQPVG